MGENKAADKKGPLALSLSDRLHKLISDPRPATTTTEPKVAPASVKTGNDGVPGGG